MLRMFGDNGKLNDNMLMHVLSPEGGVLRRHAVGPIVRSALTGLPTTRGPLDNPAPTRRSARLALPSRSSVRACRMGWSARLPA
jgi:hypothetical protein